MEAAPQADYSVDSPEGTELDGQSGLLPSVSVRPARKCHAHNRDGELCGKWAEEGYEVCRLHGAGGGAPVRHGKYTKYLPKRLQDRYLELVNSPDYVDLRDQIAGQELWVQEVLARMETCDSLERRRDILAAIEDLEDDINTGLDDDEIRDRLREIRNNATSDTYYDQCRKDYQDASECLRKLKETEVKRMVAANQVLTVTESYNLITRTVQLVEEFVVNPEARARMIRELYKLLDRK